MTAARRTDRLETGYFRMRLVKGGPMVACAIRKLCHCTPMGGFAHDWDPELCDRHAPPDAWIGGELQKPRRAWDIWTFGEAITKEEYDYMLAAADWARSHAPDEPSANPGRAVDLMTAPPPF